MIADLLAALDQELAAVGRRREDCTFWRTAVDVAMLDIGERYPEEVWTLAYDCVEQHRSAVLLGGGRTARRALATRVLLLQTAGRAVADA
ncbi:hypothetical protein [Fodinicola feengrottensis]|uniref:Uncharacterized protein n=1 Tax=Fodinicola feengrottensis TaxID=435914 RepID=A0ABP4UUH8_9ACTN|nr:hypothetical protein [Fodinicola feengrottensis]